MANSGGGERGLVARVLESSFIDGPGHRAVVFMQGCALRCRYCHNPETRGACDSCGLCIGACPSGALALDGAGTVFWDEARCDSCDACIAACPRDASPRARSYSAPALAERLAPLAPFLDGVTFSGGECLEQGDFVVAAAGLIRAARPGLTVIADTNGEIAPDDFDGFISELDACIIDLKAWGEGACLALTGASGSAAKRNLGAAAGRGKLAEARTVLVDGVNDREEDILASARFLASLGDGFAWRLLPFRPQGVRGEYALRPPYPDPALRRALAIARSVLGERAVGPASAD